MRPGRAQTGMSLYQPPYIKIFFFCIYTRPAWQWTETSLTLSWLLDRNEKLVLVQWYHSHAHDNNSQTGSRNFKQACKLLGLQYIYKKKYILLLSSWTQAPNIFVLVSCKRLHKFHTSTSSYWSEFVPVPWKYLLKHSWPSTYRIYPCIIRACV